MSQLLSREDYRPLDFKITHTNLDIYLDTPLSRVKSILSVKQENPLAKVLTLNGRKLQLESIKVNGQFWQNYDLTVLPGIEEEQLLAIDLHTISDCRELQIEIINYIDIPNNLSLSGIYQSGDSLLSQCEAQGFRAITFYLDRPDNLSIFTTRINAPTNYEHLLAGGKLLASGIFQNGKRHFALWHDPFPKPCYIWAIVVGNFDVLADKYRTKSGRTVDLRLYAEPGKLKQLSFALDALKRSMAWDEQRFNLEYDLDLFMIVGASFFNAGAMENKGINTFNDEYLIGCKDTATDKQLIMIDSVIAHEYFHNWTGDRVTCRDWFQLTLKEGLTVFRDQEYTADTIDRTIKRLEDAVAIQSYQFNEDNSPLAHPIRPDEVKSIDNFYTATVYEKGAEVIRLIHTLIGEEKFQQGMKIYFERWDGKAATCDDFVDAMQEASSYDFNKFRRWYSQAGTPEVEVTTVYDALTKTQKITFKQAIPSRFVTTAKEPLVIALKTHYLTANGQTLTNLQTIEGELVPELLVFDQEEYSFTLANIPEKLLVVTNLDFSSPVKIKQEVTNQDLFTIASHCKNLYGRFNALQAYFLALYQRYLPLFTYEQNIEIAVDDDFKHIFNSILSLASKEPNLTALILSNLDFDRSKAALEEPYNPIVAKKVEKAIQIAVAKNFKEDLLTIYRNLPLSKWEFTADSIAKRNLRREILKLLTLESSNEHLVSELFEKSDNFSDYYGALVIAMRNNLPCKESLINLYRKRFADNEKVLRNLIDLQYLNANSLEEVKEILTDPLVDFTNPNCIYSFESGFTRNVKLFFNKDGLEFYRKKLLEVNAYNASVAASMATPLAQLDNYVEPYRSNMQQVIEELLNHELALNVKEILERALEFTLKK